MSNRFVSAGKIGSSGEISKDANGTESSSGQLLNDSVKSKEWEVVEKELEAERKRREEARVKAATGEGEKSLYDILQANKDLMSQSANQGTPAAKQAEFEEQTKLRNQFRALDDDEIEFLDEIRANKRAEEERVKRETEEGLKAFRERQKGDAGLEEPADVQEEGESWGVGRKRKRNKERDVKGPRRKVSGAEETGKQDEEAAAAEETRPRTEEEKPRVTAQPATKPPEKKGLALVGYGSDSDDD
ncbi:hypothetical protein NW762_000921 [Fusarium torreyae]|uniref:FAM192A/Fyv6 N-terminal domain-containing protein n=1 Tax=Fusarium torreyae TaxID=1237075 RepID=A0A9W8VQT0_9HYPO|nr:hypothetical protein NW762_000921 [Fusarium torreyae]